MKFVIPKAYSNRKGHYSAGVISQNLLFISGMLSLDLNTGTPCKGGIREHMQKALSNLNMVLEEASLSKESVVQCRIYIADISYWDEVNEIYSEFFSSHKPARVVVPVGKLHFGCLVEIEAVAEVK